MEQMFSWDVVGWVVALFVPLGLAVIAFRGYRFAKVCFAVSALVLMGRTFMWARMTNMPFWGRAVICTVVFGVIGFAFVETARWIDRKKTEKEPPPTSKLPATITQTQPDNASPTPQQAKQSQGVSHPLDRPSPEEKIKVKTEKKQETIDQVSIPKLKIDVFSSKVYQEPLKPYRIFITNDNTKSASIYDFRVEFIFHNQIISVEQWPVVITGNIGIGKVTIFGQVERPEMPRNCSYVIQQSHIDNQSFNTNALVFSCERWPRNVGAFSANVLVDTSKNLEIRKGPEGTYRGMYFYEVNDKPFSETIYGVITEQRRGS